MKLQSGWVLGVALVGIAACTSQVRGPLRVEDGGRDIVDGAPATDTAAGADADTARDDASTADHAETAGDGGDGSDRSPDVMSPDVEGDTPPDAAHMPIWTDASTAIDVLCVGYHDGQMRFRARRDQLSPEQLTLLADLAFVQTRAACVTDLTSCTIAIAGDGGAVSTYVTYAFDQTCGNPSNQIAYATFQPFERTLTCRFGRETASVGVPFSSPVTPDERCFNGILGIGGVTQDPLLSETAAGVTRHVEIDGCPVGGSAVAFQILTPDGTQSVAAGAPVATPGADQTCLRVDHAFSAAGDYRLHLSVAGADAGNSQPFGWLFYRYF